MNKKINYLLRALMLMEFFIGGRFLNAQEISFSSSGLLNENINNPTSLDFGPDGRLYVSEQDGTLLAFDIERNDAGPGEGIYRVVKTEVISTVQTGIPNHTDDGIATTIKLRQVTGILTGGTPSNPIVYVTSSDNLIGGGGAINDKNLDTNSGVLSQLTWNGEAWDKVDLVRGLPRCEENHSINGMDIFQKNGQSYLLVQQGGHSNKGAPSNNFVGTPEYFLSGALLVVNLSQLASMPVYIDPRYNTQYVYDLPTLNDPLREDITHADANFPYPLGHPLYHATIDVGDPFGGDDGLNQAFAEVGGPVQIFSPGYRNAYDVVITENGGIYTFDNGPNTGWGGLPLIYNADGILKGDQSNTSYLPDEGDYIINGFNEIGSGGHGDPLHYVGTIFDDNGTYYGGHPNPILAFPSRADLFTYKNIEGAWQEVDHFTLGDTLQGVSGYFNDTFSLSDFPDDPRLGNYLSNALNSNEVNILDIVNSSTNGITQYTATHFDGALKGDILSASFNGNINRYKVSDTGELVSKEVLFNGFGATPLDVIALPDDHLYAGTVWAATYGADNITIFEPSDLNCVGLSDPDFDPGADNDGDGYSNQDELDNGTNFCSGGSTPKDNDNDLLSDLNDDDDDNDNIADVDDVFAIDPLNGMGTFLPVNYPFWNNNPGRGFFGLGFTGLMLNPDGGTDYLNQFNENNISFGGAAGKASIDLVTPGDAIGSTNSQEYGFQFGVNVDSQSPTFTVHSRIESPFFGIGGSSTAPLAYQSTGIFIGNGDQNNYLKVVLGHGVSTDDETDGIEILLESDDGIIKERIDVPGLLDGNAVDIFIHIIPTVFQAQVYISTDGGININAIGEAVTLPDSFLDENDDKGMAAGIIATSTGASAFSSIWDFMNVTIDQPGVIEANIDEGGIDFGRIVLGGNTALLNLEVSNLSGPADDLIDISSIEITGDHASLFLASLELPQRVGPGAQIVIPLTFNPTGMAGVKTANLLIHHTGVNSPLSIPLTAIVDEEFQALLRINAGGPKVNSTDGGPDWLADDGVNSSPLFNVNTGKSASFNLLYEDKDDSIADYIDKVVFDALFASERWDPAGGDEMEYSFPLENANYIVKLYLGNGYPGTANVASRIYDITIEDNTVMNDLDLVQRFGHESGGMLEYRVSVEDGELNLLFTHAIENPLVNAIEILSISDRVQELRLNPIDDRMDSVDGFVDFAVLADGGSASKNLTYAISGQPDGIDIEPTNGHVFGTVLASALSGGIAHNGVHTVTVTVSQEGLDSVTQEFEWVINEPALSWTDTQEDENYVARHECSFVQAGDRFVMFGGRESAQQLDMYDYINNTWSQGAQAPLEFNHFQARTYEGLIWVIGAFKNNTYPNEVPAEHIYMYNPAAQEWIKGVEIPEQRRRGGAALVMRKDKFYIIGGNTSGHNGGYVAWFDEYNPATGEWKVLADAPHARDHFHGVTMDDNLYAMGGRLSGGEGGVFAPLVAQVDVYDFNSQTWSTLDAALNLPTPRAGASIANFDNEIYVMGGEGAEAGPAFNVVEIFDPQSKLWRNGTSMNHHRHGTQAIVSGDGIYIAGGSPNRGGGRQKNMEVLGDDEPLGQAIVSSELISQENTLNFTYKTEDSSVELRAIIFNSLGNAANFIDYVNISGQGFVLNDNYNQRLLNANGELTLGVTFTPTHTLSARGQIDVHYNSASTLSIILEGANSFVQD